MRSHCCALLFAYQMHSACVRTGARLWAEGVEGGRVVVQSGVRVAVTQLLALGLLQHCFLVIALAIFCIAV